MTFYAFRQLSPIIQGYWVLKLGTFLAQRWDEDGGVNLYHCADEGRGFFVEVGMDDDQELPVVLRSFVSSVPLEDYSYWIRLPESTELVVTTNYRQLSIPEPTIR